MKCPVCENPETKVIDSREIEKGLAIRRRRQCLKCNNRFTTYEKFLIIVLKKGGKEEIFDRSKIIKGLQKAFHKRNVKEEEIQNIAKGIEDELTTKGVSKIDSKEIGKMILDRLKMIDKVAYIRFASVYFETASIEDFDRMIKELSRKRRK